MFRMSPALTMADLNPGVTMADLNAALMANLNPALSMDKLSPTFILGMREHGEKYYYGKLKSKRFMTQPSNLIILS